MSDITTGKLKLSISSSFYGYSNRTISDTKTQTLEERLNKFFAILLEITKEERLSEGLQYEVLTGSLVLNVIVLGP